LKFLREKACWFVFLCFVVSMVIVSGGRVEAYYGGGLYGSGSAAYGGIGSITGSGSSLGSVYYGSGLGGYGGLYGGSSLYGGYGGLYGSSLYGGYGGLYGSSLGGLYGSSLGGLYGSSLYGGYGGLYGSSLGGLYGGGLYGAGLGSSLYGRLGLDNAVAPRQSQVLLSGLTTLLGTSLPGTTTSTSVSAVPALPDPTGTWSGTWLSYITLKGGIANFSLLYDPLTLTVGGTAGLLANKLIPIPINVSGLNSATGFTLTGSYLDPISLVTYYASYSCTLVSPSFMTGSYIIHDALYLQSDTGEFNLSLVI
jgi:hypothetical protein